MKALIIMIFWFPAYMAICLAFAWLPMLGWNHGLHEVYPNLFPEISYMQTFFILMAVGGLFSRPQFHNKD